MYLHNNINIKIHILCINHMLSKLKHEKQNKFNHMLSKIRTRKTEQIQSYTL